MVRSITHRRLGDAFAQPVPAFFIHGLQSRNWRDQFDDLSMDVCDFRYRGFRSSFVDSYKRQLEIYCSSILVNAMCAMACHLHSVTEADVVDFERLGGEFGDAVRASIIAEDKSITTIQAFAVMFLVDCARANGLRASSYLKVATNNLASVAFLESNGFGEVWTNTVRGVRNLTVLVDCHTLSCSP
jgi:hypothetical protein